MPCEWRLVESFKRVVVNRGKVCCGEANRGRLMFSLLLAGLVHSVYVSRGCLFRRIVGCVARFDGDDVMGGGLLLSSRADADIARFFTKRCEVWSTEVAHA